MRIGIDFDNTIVSYDLLFHRVAVEQGHAPAGLPQTKLAVRDHLRGVGREEVWTEIQGYVYGARMSEADMFPGLIDFLTWARDVGIDVCIVSHKTRHPFLGPRYDLHAVAKEWIANRLVDVRGRLVPEGRTFFELTKEAKLARIADGALDYFIDDLPEILLAPGFPQHTRPILFSPEGVHNADLPLCMANWTEIQRFMDAQWKQPT